MPCKQLKTYSKDINVYCDAHKDECYCWYEDSVTLNWWQGKSVAFKILKAVGWVLGKDKDICPYCSKGIKQFNCTTDKSDRELIKNADKK